MTEALLILNAGSTSLKFTVYRVAPGGGDPVPLAKGVADGLGDTPHLRITGASDGASDGAGDPDYCRNKALMDGLKAR